MIKRLFLFFLIGFFCVCTPVYARGVKHGSASEKRLKHRGVNRSLSLSEEPVKKSSRVLKKSPKLSRKKLKPRGRLRHVRVSEEAQETQEIQEPPVKEHVVLQSFKEAFPYQLYEAQCSEVDRNEEVIFRHICELNPDVSEREARQMASALAIQGKEKNVDPKLVAAVMSVESRFNRRAYHNGAMGLGQLMKSTAKNLGITDPYDAAQNIQATTQYIRDQLDLYTDSDYQAQLALACYLLGPVAVDRYHDMFPARVHAYVHAVLEYYQTLLDDFETTPSLDISKEEEADVPPQPTRRIEGLPEGFGILLQFQNR